MKQLLQAVIPKFSFAKHKGQDGRLCVVGGSLEYTGAPYFAAQSALRCGADLVHVLCDVKAGLAIKAYSPELMVAPYLDSSQQQITKELDIWIKESLPRMHSITIGPVESIAS